MKMMIGSHRSGRFARMLRATADLFELPSKEILGRDQHAYLVLPRHLVMWMAKNDLKWSLPRIAREVGGRHHTTVLHAVLKIERLRHEDPEIQAALELILEASRK